MALSILLEDSVVDSVQKPSPIVDIGKQRDPFNPVKKPRSIKSSQKKPTSQTPKSSPTSTVKYPDWKLLGVIQGQYVRLAVIQTVSGKRLFVEPGQEPIRAGWIMTTIRDTEVHFEYASSAAKRKGLPRPKTFILSFPTIGKSS